MQIETGIQKQSYLIGSEDKAAGACSWQPSTT